MSISCLIVGGLFKDTLGFISIGRALVFCIKNHLGFMSKKNNFVFVDIFVLSVVKHVLYRSLVVTSGAQAWVSQDLDKYLKKVISKAFINV